MGEYLRKTSCTKCGSSDANAEYRNDDGELSYYCHACHQYTNSDSSPPQGRKRMFERTQYSATTVHDISCLPYRKFDQKRKICDEVNQRFGVRVSYNEKTNEPSVVHYPYFIGTDISGYKDRVLPKEFRKGSGNTSGVDLFGQHLCSVLESPSLIITEGEEDCLAFYQCLWEAAGRRKHPNVVSLPNGSGTDLDKHKDFLAQFSRIYLSFDADKPGREAIAKANLALDSEQLYVVALPYKDASECVMRGGEEALVEAFKTSQRYSPPGIVNLFDLKDIFLNPPIEYSAVFPVDCAIIRQKTAGFTMGRLDVFTSGTSNGKTQLFREFIYGLLTLTKEFIGVISLEELAKDTAEGLVAIHLNRRINLPAIRSQATTQELSTAFDEVANSQRIHIYDHFGSEVSTTILSAIKYLATTKQCKFIFLDHLTILVSQISGEGRDQEKIDKLMVQLKTLAVTYKVWVGLIVHLRKVDGQGISFEDGKIPSEDDLKGSGSIKQIADSVYAIQRNRRHPNEEMRHVMRLHVLKHRITGYSGPADFLKFDTDTGRLVAIPPPLEDILTKKVITHDEDF